MFFLWTWTWWPDTKYHRCGNIGSLAIEDVLHMGPSCRIAKTIECEIADLPPAEVTYSIRPMKAYCVRNPITRCLGVLFYNDSLMQVSIEFQANPGDLVFQNRILDLFSWQDEMKEMGYIMLPMIWRAGACISWENKVGCLVPPSAPNQHDGNFSIQDLGYVALFHDEKLKIGVMDTLAHLLPIGQKLFLDLSCESAACLVRRLPQAIRPGDLANTVLRVFLDAPDTLEPPIGKVFVACLVKQLNSSNRNQVVGSRCETIMVDPWEVGFLDNNLCVLDHIMSL